MNISFRADRGGVDQIAPWNVGAYTMLSWPTKEFDNGGRLLNGGVWYPVQAGEPAALVQIASQVWIKNALSPSGYNTVQCALPNPPDNPSQYVVKLIKNAYPGVDIATGFSSLGVFQNTVTCYLPAVLDIAQPGDSYSLWLYAANGACAVDGNKAHTWWSGMVVP